jgi:sec-independent protein translocase protein TatB
MLSIPHLIVIFVVALVIFGPEKLPELARNLGKVMADFKRATGDFRSTFEDHLRDLERETTDRKIGGGSSARTSASTSAGTTTGTTILSPQPAETAAQPVGTPGNSAVEPAALPPAPGSVTANEPYLSRASTPPPEQHDLENHPKIAPAEQPESSSETVSNGRKRPG